MSLLSQVVEYIRTGSFADGLLAQPTLGPGRSVQADYDVHWAWPHRPAAADLDVPDENLPSNVLGATMVELPTDARIRALTRVAPRIVVRSDRDRPG